MEEKAKELNPEFERFFQTLLDKQVNQTDLLLVNENGFYAVDNAINNLDPYIIGVNFDSMSEDGHYHLIKFFSDTLIEDITFDDFINNNFPSLKIENDMKLRKKHLPFIIHLQMLIYLKIWESDAFIKRFYQWVRLINGEPYDWHFKIAESNRDKGGLFKPTGNRDELIRIEIRERLKIDFPIIYKYFKDSFLTQLRNSIAHSKYFVLNDFSIHLNNSISIDRHAQKIFFTFSEWMEMFHTTLAIYEQYITLRRKTGKHYEDLALNDNSHILKTVVNRKDIVERVEDRSVKYSPGGPWGKWTWFIGDDRKGI